MIRIQEMSYSHIDNLFKYFEIISKQVKVLINEVMGNECNEKPCYRTTIFMKFHKYILTYEGSVLY